MTFVYRNKCIFQLHSSALPELNKDLYIGGTFLYTINKHGAEKILNYIGKN